MFSLRRLPDCEASFKDRGTLKEAVKRVKGFKDRGEGVVLELFGFRLVSKVFRVYVSEVQGCDLLVWFRQTEKSKAVYRLGAQTFRR